jgi:hypothetical protein
MEMGEQDEIDPIALDAEPVHGDQRGSAAIDQEISLRADNVKAGIETPPGPEGVTTPDELQLHSFLRAPLGSMGAGLPPCQRGTILLDCVGAADAGNAAVSSCDE